MPLGVETLNGESSQVGSWLQQLRIATAETKTCEQTWSAACRAASVGGG